MLLKAHSGSNAAKKNLHKLKLNPTYPQCENNNINKYDFIGLLGK